MTQAVIWMRPEFMPGTWLLIWCVVSIVGFVLALRWIVQDELVDLAARRRLIAATLCAVMLSGAALSADYIITDICGPMFLREICGGWWYVCYVVSGCPLLIY